MTPSEPVKPTPGALRAANAINMCEGDLHYECDIEIWADIIDEATGAKAMYEALEEISRRDPCYGQNPDSCRHGMHASGCIGCVARRALRVAREESRKLSKEEWKEIAAGPCESEDDDLCLG